MIRDNLLFHWWKDWAPKPDDSFLGGPLLECKSLCSPTKKKKTLKFQKIWKGIHMVKQHRWKDFCDTFSFIRKFGRYYTWTLNGKEKGKGAVKERRRKQKRENGRQRTKHQDLTGDGSEKGEYRGHRISKCFSLRRLLVSVWVETLQMESLGTPKTKSPWPEKDGRTDSQGKNDSS